jgi:multiple sugar transport system permease protein
MSSADVTVNRSRKAPRGGKLSMRTREAIVAYLFLSPWLVGFVVFWAGATLASLYLSFTDYTILAKPNWIGLYNYIKLFTWDRLFVQSITNTVYYVVFEVPLSLFLSFVMALLLNTKVRGMTIFRTMFYLPSVVPTVASVAVWMWMFTPRVGLVNVLLKGVGIGPPNWLSSTTWSKPALILISLWGVGGNMVTFLAGLQGIPEALYEAAEIDGAGSLRKLYHVTIPLMTPTIFYNLVISLIRSFQVFTVAYIATGGGPLNSTRFYLLKLYRHAFSSLEMGYASAMAWLLFIVVLVLTILVFATGRRWVFYQAEGPR